MRSTEPGMARGRAGHDDGRAREPQGYATVHLVPDVTCARARQDMPGRDRPPTPALSNGRPRLSFTRDNLMHWYSA